MDSAQNSVKQCYIKKNVICKNASVTAEWLLNITSSYRFLQHIVFIHIPSCTFHNAVVHLFKLAVTLYYIIYSMLAMRAAVQTKASRKET